MSISKSKKCLTNKLQMSEVFIATPGHKHSMLENDTNVIQIRFSSAVSMTTCVVCTGLQLQQGTFKSTLQINVLSSKLLKIPTLGAPIHTTNNNINM